MFLRTPDTLLTSWGQLLMDSVLLTPPSPWAPPGKTSSSSSPFPGWQKPSGGCLHLQEGWQNSQRNHQRPGSKLAADRSNPQFGKRRENQSRKAATTEEMLRHMTCEFAGQIFPAVCEPLQGDGMIQRQKRRDSQTEKDRERMFTSPWHFLLQSCVGPEPACRPQW